MCPTAQISASGLKGLFLQLLAVLPSNNCQLSALGKCPQLANGNCLNQSFTLFPGSLWEHENPSCKPKWGTTPKGYYCRGRAFHRVNHITALCHRSRCQSQEPTLRNFLQLLSDLESTSWESNLQHPLRSVNSKSATHQNCCLFGYQSQLNTEGTSAASALPHQQ